jgi:anaerobic ribonucleoside-triphosphate reductase activating protein
VSSMCEQAGRGDGAAVAERRAGQAAPAVAERREAPVRSLRLAGLMQDSIVDGPGLRLVVFAQGCPHHCPGCHNPHTHSYGGGQLWEMDDLLNLVRNNPLLDGITLSGGEPFAQAEGMADLAERAKKLGLHVMTYTGYTFEQLLAGMAAKPGWRRLLERTDVLVDGLFMQERRSLALLYRGSGNQRLLDVPASLMRRAVVPADMDADRYGLMAGCLEAM